MKAKSQYLKFTLFVMLYFTTTISFSQILISQGGTVNVTGGEIFYDAGGAAGNDGNTSYTITLMPANSGKAVCVDFTSFSSYESLEIFDGTSVSATNIGTLKGNYGTAYNAAGAPYNTGQPALGGVVQAELKPGIFCANNATGALTFRFTNSGASQSTGWVGTVSTFAKTTSGCTVDLISDKTSICPNQIVNLSAVGTIGSSALSNDFNTGVIGTGWNSTPGGVAFFSVLSCEPNGLYTTIKPDNTIFAWMQNVAAPRVLESNNFDVSNGGVLSFDFREASDDNGGNGCEALDDKEGIYIQYSTNNGASWTNMKLMFPSLESNFNASANIGAGTYVYNWNKTTLPIPLAAQTTSTKFRWYQHQCTTGSQDSWGIDEVKIIKNNPVTFTITNLTTNSIIATSNTTTVATSVNPSTTTSYRATITDGTTTCSDDVTINVIGGTPATIAYIGSPFLNTITTPQAVTVTNGPVMGIYTASPAGLTIDTSTGAITPSTSTPGTYTISVPATCGNATASVTISNSTCATCATATCPAVSITAATAALGQTNITTAINAAGDMLGLTPLIPGQSVTVCVPVIVVAGSTMLGFKQNFLATTGCGDPTEQIITYQLRPASNCLSTPIIPNRTNASGVGSGFNPEWDNLPAGNYVLCFTINVTISSACNPVDLKALGYYNIIPLVTCQDYQIQMFNNDGLSSVHNSTSFLCTDSKVYLGPVNSPTIFDGGLPYPALSITITAITGNTTNLIINRYDPVTGLAEVLTFSTPINNYFINSTPGEYYTIDKTDLTSGTYSYVIKDVITGAILTSGTWTIIAGAESNPSATIIPTGNSNYSGPGVVNGFDPAGVDNYTNNRGIGIFDPCVAGVGTHTITYTWDNGLTGTNHCTLTRTKNITVTGSTSAPTASGVSICSGTSATITATATTGNIVKWYDAASGGVLLFTGNPYTTPILTTTTSYWVTQTSQCCGESARTKVIVTVNAMPLAPTVVTPVTYCQNATASPLTASGSGLLWYTVATGGIGSATAPTPSTASAGSINYYVSQTILGCEGPRAFITVTVNAMPIAPSVTTPVTYCQNATASPLTATGSGLLWYTVATGGIGSATAPIPSTASAGSINYYVSQTILGCEGPRASITVTVNATPIAPSVTTPVTYCQNATASPLTATGSGLLWYTVATGGIGSATAPTPSTASAGSINYYVSQTILGCEGPRAFITVTVNAMPIAPSVTTPVTYCQNAPASPLTATGSGLLWYTVATGGIGSATAPIPSTASAGSINYYVSQTILGCESPRASITVTVNAMPLAPTVVTPVTYCQNATASPLTATGSGLLWYTVATGGIGSATAPTPSTIAAGNTTYYVSQTVLGCEGPRASITVTVNATPLAPSVTTPVTYCQNAIASPLTATGSSLLWYTVATGGIGSATAPTPSTIAAGNTTYYVSQTILGCESPRASITVTVNAMPLAPSVTTPVTYCQNATASPLTATGSGLLWYTVATGGIGSATAPTPSTIAAGNTTYYVSQTILGCEGPRASITVTVNATPLAPSVTTPVTYCQNAIASPLTATGSNLLWYTVAIGGIGSATAPTPSTTSIGSTNYYVSQTILGCVSPRAIITVIVNPVPIVTVNSSTICQGQSATVTATVGSPGSYSYSWTVPAGVPPPGNVSNFTTSVAGTYSVIISNVSSLCNLDFEDPCGLTPASVVTVNQSAFSCWKTTATDGMIEAWSSGFNGVTAYSGSQFVELNANQISTLFQDISVFPSSSVSISFAHRGRITGTDVLELQIGPVGGPYTSLGQFSAQPANWVFNTVSYTFPNNGVTNYSLRFVSVSSGTGDLTVGNFLDDISITPFNCPSTSASGTVTVNATPVVPTVTTPVTYCQNSTASALTATGSGLLWYTVATGGIGSATAPTPSTIAAGNTTYYVSQTVLGCEGPRAFITVTVNAMPLAPSVTTPVTYCQNATASPLTATGSGLLWYTVATGGIGSATAPTPSTASAGSINYYVSQTILGCEGPRASITVTVNPTPAAPTVVTPVTYCQNATASALTATGSGLLWYTAAIGGVGSPTAPTPSTATAGSTNNYVSQTILGCEGPRASITVTVNATPLAPTVVTPVTYCQNATASPLTASGSGLLWYTVATGGIGSATAPTPSTASAGSINYYVSQTILGCESPRASITVTFNTTPLAPTVATLVTYCQNATASALTATGSNLLWYTVATGGIGSATAPTPSTAAAGNIDYFVSQTVLGCEGPRASITVTVNATPLAPTVATPVTYCQNAIATPLTATGSGLLWYTVATGGIGSAIAPTPSTIAAGNTTYYVSQTVLGCEGPRTFITITVNAAPLAPIVISPVTYCQNDTASALTASGSNLLWYTVATGGIGSATAPTPSTIAAGNTTYYVSQTILGCESPRNFITVSILTAPTINIPTSYQECDDNNDGVSCLFVLNTKDTEVSNQAGITITYHLTPTDAQTGDNPIPKNTPYCNITNPQTIYVRVFNPAAPACSSATSFQLIVNPKPVANLPVAYHLCDDNTDGIQTFNLIAVVTPQVLGTTLLATDYTVTYFTSLANAQAGTPFISPATAFVTATTTVWIRVQNNATGCYDIITESLVVDPLPTTLAFYPQYELCEDLVPVCIETFDLTTKITSILLGQTGMQVTFYPSLAEATNNTNPILIPSAYPNVIPCAQTLGIRITNTLTGCYVISTMDIVVNPKPQPIPPTGAYTVCGTDQTGLSCVDLTTNVTPNILFQSPGVYSISYHLTASDATNNLNAVNASNYCTINPFAQFLWVRAENPITHCFSIMPIEINVDPAPIMPTNLVAIANCDVDSNAQDGCTTFNLEVQTPIILAAQASAPANYSVTYYTTQVAASSAPAGLSIFNTTSYTACTTSTVWVRIENIATHCFTVGSFQLQVNTPIVLTTPTLYSLCDSDAIVNNQYSIFNMLAFVGNVPGHTLQFFLDVNHNLPISNPSAFQNTIAAAQTVFVVATNTATGCKSYTTLTIQVLPIPTPRTDLSALPLIKCDDVNPNDGYEIFDLTINAAYVINNDVNVSLHYFPSHDDAVNNTAEIMLPTAANVHQNVWIRVESLYNIDTQTPPQHCYVLVEQPIVVNPLPLIVSGHVYQECDDDTDGFTVFNLNSQAGALLAGNALPLTNYTLAFYLNTPPSSPPNTPIPSTFTNTNTTGNTQTIYVVATNTVTGCKSPVSQFTIMVNPKPTLEVPLNYSSCDDELNDNDGYHLYPLDDLILAILGATQTLTDYDVNFYDTQYNPSATPPLLPTAITNLSTYQAYTHTIWVVVKNKVTGCERIASFKVTVEQKPQPKIVADTNVICVDFNPPHQVVRELVLTATNTTPYIGTLPTYTYQWLNAAGVAIPGATNSTFTVSTAFANLTSSDFSVVMTSTSAQGCKDTSAPFTVLQSGQAVTLPAGSQGYTITNAFSENQTLTVTVTGFGTYEYSLDDGPRQSSNVFENVGLGEHFITVWDTKGGIAISCDPLVINHIQTIDYPHYFTPNGDGIHDTWNISGLQTDLSAKIYIFDRFGKLIKQISPQGLGWDGTYNGNQLPSTDYWFTVDYSEAAAYKQFKAHFSLKR